MGAAVTLKPDVHASVPSGLFIPAPAAKWAPSNDRSADRATLLATTIATMLFPEEKPAAGEEAQHFVHRLRMRYQKEVLAPLRLALHIPEVGPVLAAVERQHLRSWFPCLLWTTLAFADEAASLASGAHERPAVGENRLQAGELECAFLTCLARPQGTILPCPAAFLAHAQQLLTLPLSDSISSFL